MDEYAGERTPKPVPEVGTAIQIWVATEANYGPVIESRFLEARRTLGGIKQWFKETFHDELGHFPESLELLDDWDGKLTITLHFGFSDWAVTLEQASLIMVDR